MDSAHQALIVALKSIRDQADSALKKIEQRGEQRSLSWKCTTCGHTKHFTRPALAEVAARVRNVAEQRLIPSSALSGMAVITVDILSS
jgi:hypothetical protein